MVDSLLGIVTPRTAFLLFVIILSLMCFEIFQVFIKQHYTFTALWYWNRYVVFTARCYASAVLAMTLCPSVTSRSSAKTAERIELVFGMWVSFHPSYTVLKGNSLISKNKGTSLWNFVLKSRHWKFHHGISIIKMCYQLCSRKVDAQSVINWAVVGQLSR